MEHRWGQRRAVDIATQLRTPGGVIAQGRISNVSVSGAFIATKLPLALLSHVNVRLARPASERGARGHAEAQVVRRESDGIAVEWCELAPAAVRALLPASGTHTGTVGETHEAWRRFQKRR